MFRRYRIVVASCVAAMVGALLGLSDPSSASSGEAPAGQSTASRWLQVMPGGQHTCGIQADHTLWCWGYNRYGELGIGDGGSRTVPTRVGSGSDWMQVSSGWYHVCAIRTDQTLWCWGRNAHGQLGLGHKGAGDKYVPTQVGTDTNWAGVSAGYDHTCATRTDQTLWCWGWNQAGQLGVGFQGFGTKIHIPHQVGTDTNWSQVTAGGFHTCATRTDQTLWCWGSNSDGQVGIDERPRAVVNPTQVGADADWAQLDLGYVYSCAIRTDHTLWCWGANGSGQLGLGDQVQRRLPTQVGIDDDWVQVRSGASFGHTCATRAGNTLWCWGQNDHGQLGVGDTIERDLPTQVGARNHWAQVITGYLHTCAIRTGATLWCWGGNSSGQLGLGDTSDRLVPTRV